MKRTVFATAWLPYLLVLAAGHHHRRVLLLAGARLAPAQRSYRASPFGDRMIFVGLGQLRQAPHRSRVLPRARDHRSCSPASSPCCGGAWRSWLAALANAKIRGLGVYRTLLLWPYGIAPAIAGILFLFIFHPSYGVLPYLLVFVTAYEFNWFLKGWVAMVLVIVATAWKHVRLQHRLLPGRAAGHPGSVLEAASVDGAGPIRRFPAIIFPLLSPITFFLLMLNMMFAFFELVRRHPRRDPGRAGRRRPRSWSTRPRRTGSSG